MNSQWKNRNIRKTPPPTRRKGDESSITFLISGLSLNVDVNAPTGPRVGFVAHTMSHGSIPLTTKTANSNPYERNHFLARSDIVERTSALITALSMLLIVSNSIRPTTISIIEKISIIPRFLVYE